MKCMPNLVSRQWLLVAAGVLTAFQGWAAQQPTVNSHEVNADHSVTFRYYAPSARKVEIRLDYDSHPIPLKKGSDGLWTLRTGPLQPALHFYGLAVDDVPIFDPLNQAVDPTYFFVGNQVRVPGSEPQLWDVTDVPHGVLHHHIYHSAVIANLPDGMEDYYVYTPPGYDAEKARLYPVLYLFHGWAGRADSWVQDGQANLIMDNLIARSLAKPMIVVMPLGYGDLNFVTKGFGVWHDPSAIADNVERFSKALLTEIMPQIEAGYRVTPDRNNRAVAGLSMGGGQSLLIGLNHPEIFGFVGGFSSALGSEPYDSIFPHLGVPSEPKPDLVWIACGTDDALITSNRGFISWLKAKGVEATAIETPGIHNWPVWRDNLVHFAPLLFRRKVGRVDTTSCRPGSADRLKIRCPSLK
jgi:enterochelin esterase-like enzyme